MVRLKDVAARAGVSLMTVSKVLRDAPDVSSVTKTRIRRLVEEMGYVPDALARGLRTRRTKLLGLVLPSLTHPLLAAAAVALEDRAYELGYDVLLAQTQDDPQREEVALRRILARRVDGLFLSPVYRLAPTAPVYEELRASRTPTVLLGHPAAFCSSFVHFASDDLAASSRMTQHLLSLGHQQIAFFAGPPAAPSAQEQLEGYRRALREANIAFDDRLIFTAGFSVEDGQRAAQQMLNEGTDASAVQTTSDLVAAGAAAVFRRKGIRIPGDISITGFGHFFGLEHLHLPLTTVQIPKHALGVAAAQAMFRLLHEEKVESKRFPAELVVRSTTASRELKPSSRNGPANTSGDELQ